MEEGNAYYFNSYHYHNVYNPTNDRTSIMFYVDLNHPHIENIINHHYEVSSIQKTNRKSKWKPIYSYREYPQHKIKTLV